MNSAKIKTIDYIPVNPDSLIGIPLMVYHSPQKIMGSFSWDLIQPTGVYPTHTAQLTS